MASVFDLDPELPDSNGTAQISLANMVQLFDIQRVYLNHPLCFRAGGSSRLLQMKEFFNWKYKFIMLDFGNLPIPIIEVLKMIERKNPETEEGRFIFRIMGDEYVVKGQDDPAYMGQIVSYLETITDSIIAANPKLSKCQVAVLAGLKIADEFHKLRQEYQYLDQLLKEAR